jgi:inner membrane transporter RhtA
VAAVVALGLVLAALNLTLYEAIARLPLGTAVTLQFLGPLAVALGGARRRRDAVWALAAAGGVALIAGGPTGGAPAGIAFALAAAAATVGSLLLTRRLATEAAGVDGLALAVAVAAVATLPAGVPAALATPAATHLAIVAAVGVLGIAVPYALEYAALRRIAARTFGVVLSLDPAIAALAGVLFLAQRLALGDVVAVGLIVAATAGATARPRSGA